MRMMKRMAAIGAVLLLLSAQTAALAQTHAPAMNDGYTQPLNAGEVNWQTGALSAKGIGVPPANAVSLAQARAMAIRAAVVDARRNLLSVIKGVQIDASTTVENAMVTNDSVVERVRGFLQNSQIIDTAYMSDGSVEVTVGINMRGGLSGAVLPPADQFSPSGPLPPLTAPVPVPPVAPVPEMPAAPVPDQEAQQAAFTGLLVDARGLGVRPAMSPKILDEDGNEVYGSASVSREYAIQQGMAGYAKELVRAQSNPRVATTPLTVKAVAVEGRAKTNLVIANADAEKLRELSGDQDFLKKCRVMIVLD